jgi:hypothetical protein
MPSNSPNFGAPPIHQPLEQLLQDDIQAFLRYMNMPRDTAHDTRDGKEAKKHPATAGMYPS